MAAAHRHATFAKGQAEKAKICSWCPAFKSFLFSHARQRRAVAALARTGDLRRDRFSGRRKKWLLPHQTRWLSCDLPRFTGRATKGLACVNRSGTHERAADNRAALRTALALALILFGLFLVWRFVAGIASAVLVLLMGLFLAVALSGPVEG